MTRLDVELVRRRLARYRGQAAERIAGGRVYVDGVAARRPATGRRPGQEVAVHLPAVPAYVSRAAHKLAGGLDALGADGPVVAGRLCLDAGASTGGFTDVLLRRGATRVVAVDVGHGQLVDALRSDPRVDVREGVNVRYLRPTDVQPSPGLVVADLSFISLTLVLPGLAAVVAPGGDLVLLVKPQFEVGRARLGRGGVGRAPGLRAEAVLRVAGAAQEAGLAVRDVVTSPMPGPSGTVEYVLWACRGGGGLTPDGVAAAVDRAVRTEPERAAVAPRAVVPA